MQHSARRCFATFCFGKSTYKQKNKVMKRGFKHSTARYRPLHLALFFLFITILSASPIAKAQTTVRFGLKGGGNYSSILGDNVPDKAVSGKLGWHGGVMLNFKSPSAIFGVQPELNYSSKGFSFDQTNRDITGSTRNQTEVRFHYLELPLLFKLYIHSFYIEAGPQASLLLGASSENKQTYSPIGGIAQVRQTDTRGKNGLNDFDYSAVLGLGYEFQRSFTFDLRYNAGLRKLVKHSEHSLPIATDARNSVLQLSIGIFVPEE